MARRLWSVANRDFLFLFAEWKLNCGRLRRGGRFQVRCDTVLEWALQGEAINKKGRLFTRNALERLESKKKGKREGRTGDDEREAGGADGDAQRC